MRGHPEAVTRRHQDAAFHKSLAEFAGVAAIRQPRKNCHASAWPHPTYDVWMLYEDRVNQSQIRARDTPCSLVNRLVMLQRQYCQPLAERRIRNGKIAAGIHVPPTPIRIMLDHPADPKPAQAKRLG